MKYYAIATNQNGAKVVIDNLPENRLGAEIEAKKFAAKNGYEVTFIGQSQNTRKGGNTLTKYARSRKANKR
ncbi:hypothetical protein D3C87_980350 [compost metagenome]